MFSPSSGAENLVRKDGMMNDVPALLVWRTSRRCDSGSCVEVARTADGMAMRDSKQADGPILRFSKSVWSDFMNGVRAGDFD